MSAWEIVVIVYIISTLVVVSAIANLIILKAKFGWRVDYRYMTLVISGLIWTVLGPIGALMSFGFFMEHCEVNDPPGRRN